MSNKKFGTQAEMKALIERLQDLFVKFNKKTTGSRGTPGKLFPPPSSAAIETFKKEQGWSFPPSYLIFLSVTNGWEKYHNSVTLIGAGGPHTQKALNYIEKHLYYDIWLNLPTKSRPTKAGHYDFSSAKKDLRVQEGVKAVMVERHYFGTNFEGTYYYFDAKKKKEDGEMEVVIELPSTGDHPRRDNFMAFLLRTAASIEVRLK